MNIFEHIYKKRDDLINLKEDSDIDAVLRHLVVAEKRFLTGVKTGDEDLYTDVIYRCNQVFEGILKEVYEVETDKPCPKRITPHIIETYLEKQSLFKPRVLQYFKAYREEWRNPSAHNHKIDFNEQEAFIAISNVSTFCYAAIDQIVYVLAEKQVVSPDQDGLNFTSFKNLGSSLTRALEATYMSMKAKDPEGAILSNGAALEGMMSGLIGSVSANANIYKNFSFRENGVGTEIDVLVNYETTKFAYEIKSYANEKSGSELYEKGLEHLEGLLNNGYADYGVLLLLPRDYDEIESEKFDYLVSKQNKNIIVVSLKTQLASKK